MYIYIYIYISVLNGVQQEQIRNEVNICPRQHSQSLYETYMVGSRRII